MNNKKILLIFDFDKTIIEEDTDVQVVNMFPLEKVKELKIKMDELSYDWIKFMHFVFREMPQYNLTIDNIKQCFDNIHLSKGFEFLFSFLKENKEFFEIVIFSGSNTFNVTYILNRFRLDDLFDCIISNEGTPDEKYILNLQRYHEHNCESCDRCMCKAKILEDYTENKQYEKIIFVCDGNNDYCLGKKLEKNDKIFVRKDYSLYRKLYNKGWKDNLQCDIKCWENGNEIVEWLKTEI